MTLEFLVFANLLLLTRLVSLFKDEAAAGRVWAVKTLVELAALAAFYRFSAGWLGAAATVAALNLLGWRWESAAARRNLGRLALGLAGIALLSLWFAPARGLGFRPALAGFGARLPDWTALAPLFQAAGDPRLQVQLFGLLLAANEANLAIRAVFDWLNLKPQRRAALPGSLELDVGEYNRGRVIGLLERTLVYFFVLSGQYGAIGFILAAKAFTRFKELDDRRFAEYVLIGTLLSATLAIGTGVLVGAALR